MGAQGSIRPDKWYASCLVQAQVSPFYISNEGFGEPIVRNGVGDHSLPLAGLPSQAVIIASALSNGFSNCVVEPIGTPVTSLRVRTRNDLGVAVDTSFSVIVIKS